MDLADVIGVLGGVAGILGGIYGFRALRKAGEANRIADQSNDIARDALAFQRASEKAERSAQLSLSPMNVGKLRNIEGIPTLNVAIQNHGLSPAYNVTLVVSRVRRHDEPRHRPTVGYAWLDYKNIGENHIQIGKERCFDIVIEDDWRENRKEGFLVDYSVGYRDHAGEHRQVFRVRMTHHPELLHVWLDGQRVPVGLPPKFRGEVALPNDEEPE